MAASLKKTGLIATLAGLAALAPAAPPAATAMPPADRWTSTPQAAAGELIVGFERTAPAAAHRKAMATVAATTTRPLPLAKTRVVSLRSGTDLREAAKQLSEMPGIAYAEPNYIRTTRAAVMPDDPSFGSQWALRSIKAPAAWRVSTGSVHAKLAIADDGVQTTHRDLAANILPGWDFVDRDRDPRPQPGKDQEASPHGTHIAGIIGAEGDNGIGISGINWKAGLIPLRIFRDDGTTTTEQIVKAFAFAGRAGAAALNASFGGQIGSRTERRAIAAWPGTLFVVAAPNQDVNIDRNPDFPCSYPQKNVICVSAADRRGRLAGQVGFGKRTVDLLAPGVQILSTAPSGYRLMTGTSMAAPQVTGAIGLIKSAYPKLTPAQIRRVLVGSPRKTRKLRGKTRSGGNLNLKRAIQAAAELSR